MDKLNKLKEEMRILGLKKLEKIKVNVGDSVLFKTKDKIEKCRVIKKYEYEGNAVVIIQNNNTVQIGWSSNTHYLTDEEIDEVKFVEEPKMNIDTLDSEIQKLEQERRKLTEKINKKIYDNKALLIEEQKKCHHKWDEGYETGKVVRHLIGESEQKEYTCKICEKIGYNT